MSSLTWGEPLATESSPPVGAYGETNSRVAAVVGVALATWVPTGIPRAVDGAQPHWARSDRLLLAEDTAPAARGEIESLHRAKQGSRSS
jgi:hypothetical protein